MKKISVAILLCFAILSAGCNTKSLRKANYDLALAINKASLTAVQLNQQGTLSTADMDAILPIFNTMSNESDAITKCIDGLNVVGNAAGCVTPLLAAINSQQAEASVGIKSSGAQATMNLVLTGITAIFAEFQSAGAAAPGGN